MAEEREIKNSIYDIYPSTERQFLKDINGTFERWGYCSSYAYTNKTERVNLDFGSFKELEVVLELALKNDIAINGEKCQCETLWDFLLNKSKISLIFGELRVPHPSGEVEYVGTGRLEYRFRLQFSRKYLGEFKKLFFEALANA